MRYQGGKAKIAKEIIEIINPKDRFFVEPFAGGLNVSCIASKFCEKIHINDIRSELISCYLKILDGWVPPKFDKSMYNKARKLELEDHEIGWAAVGCSYGGKWFGGLAATDSKGTRDYQDESFRSIKSQLKSLSRADFTSLDYREMEIKDGSLVYCDPPYKGVTGYGLKFDSDEFWAWCKKLSERCDVYVSEYSAPSFAKEIWRKEKHSPLNRSGKKSTEKLFKL